MRKNLDCKSTHGLFAIDIAMVRVITVITTFQSAILQTRIDNKVLVHLWEREGLTFNVPHLNIHNCER